MNASNEVALMAMLVALIAMPGKTLSVPGRVQAPRPDADGEREPPAVTPLQFTHTG